MHVKRGALPNNLYIIVVTHDKLMIMFKNHIRVIKK